MTIIVTGAGGFVGREVVRRLAAQGSRVVAVDSHAMPDLPAGARAVVGDIASPDSLQAAFSDGCTGLVHLATMPGGAAEADPVSARRVNVDAMFDVLAAAAKSGSRPRVVFASSIAVLGDPLPAAGVDDATPLAPRMFYGAHKAMMELALATLSRRGEVDGVSLRLPGILARPKGPSGMKSAFMSDLFHALRGGEHFICPVSQEATIWAQSVSSCAANILHALDMEASKLPEARALTLPALRIPMGQLAEEIAVQCGVDPRLVEYVPDAALEAAFGAYPPLSTASADAAGFAHDGDVARLVRNALAIIARG